MNDRRFASAPVGAGAAGCEVLDTEEVQQVVRVVRRNIRSDRAAAPDRDRVGMLEDG